MSYQIWVRFIFAYLKSLNRTFKTGFWAQITFWICVLVLWIHKGYCVVKKLVWNVRIKAFWYTKLYKISIMIIWLTRSYVSSLISRIWLEVLLLSVNNPSGSMLSISGSGSSSSESEFCSLGSDSFSLLLGGPSDVP